VRDSGPVLGRVHSECLTGDAFLSLRCDCGSQLRAALARIGAERRGVLVYLRQEGRGIGLFNKIRAYALQDEGLDTVDANVALGFEADARRYGVAAEVLHSLGIRQVRLMTNNPGKVKGLNDEGIQVVERIPLLVDQHSVNEHYLRTKASRLGHMLEV
jgi:GTP cyclohydrolase II